jgi:pyrimidine operon attenuation protein/uracil phosphoribosyltransferase
MNRTSILNARQMAQRIERIAFQIYEDNFDQKEVILAGIAPNGYEFASRLSAKLNDISSLKNKLVKITLDKDAPYDSPAQLSVDEKELAGKVVILIDDVLNSGNTMSHALRLLMNVPVKKIRSAVMVDRSHKRFPVAANYVGLSLSTTLHEHITVLFDEKEEAVFLS